MKPARSDAVALERVMVVLATRYCTELDTMPDAADRPTVQWVGPTRGAREAAVLRLSGLAEGCGLRVAEVCDQISYKYSNTYKLLYAMERSDLVERVPGHRPLRFRLTTRRRAEVEDLSALASTVRVGEWTSCSDISLAARGDTGAAALVCWAAHVRPEFPNPHRVLLEGGQLHGLGHEHGRRRPEVIRALLVSEGVQFDRFERAGPGTRVHWDDLRLRRQQHHGCPHPS